MASSASDLATASVHTRAEPAAVWRLLADPYSYARWVSGTRRIRSADDDWPAPGTQLHHRFWPPPLQVGDCTTVIECTPQQRLVLEAAAWPWGRVRAEITVCPGDGGARVELREWMLAGLAAKLRRSGHLVQRIRLQRSLARLADLCARADEGSGS